MASAIKQGFTFSLMPSGHMARFMSHPHGHYKIVKALDPLFDTLEVAATAWNASPGSLESLASGRRTIKILRHFLCLLYILGHIFPSTLELARKLGILKNKSAVDQDADSRPKDAISEVERILYWSSLAGRAIKEGSTFTAFTFKPWTSITAHQKIMLIKHLAGFFALSLEMGYHYLLNERQKIPPESEGGLKYIKKMCELFLGVLEKLLQVVHDCLKIILQTPSAKIRLPLTITIAALGLYRVWAKTS